MFNIFLSHNSHILTFKFFVHSIVQHRPRLLGLPGNSALRLIRNEVNVNITVWYNHLHVVTIMVFTQS
jgi:hypothetical protein